MSHHTKIYENLEAADNFRAWKCGISLVLEENELDSYINEEVPVLEGDEGKALHKKKLVIAKRIIADSIKDHLIHRCPSVIPKSYHHQVIRHLTYLLSLNPSFWSGK